jgi:hypothetical protein
MVLPVEASAVVFVELVTIVTNQVIRLAIVPKDPKYAITATKLAISLEIVPNRPRARLATAVEKLDISPENVLSKTHPAPNKAVECAVLALTATNAARLATLLVIVP